MGAVTAEDVADVKPGTDAGVADVRTTVDVLSSAADELLLALDEPVTRSVEFWKNEE